MTPSESIRRLHEEPGDRIAWEYLYRHIRPLLIAYVSTLVFTFHQTALRSAQDIVQDVLLNFFERWPKIMATLNTEQAVMAYLRKSCRNLLIDTYRHEAHGEDLISFLSLQFKDAFGSHASTDREIFVSQVLGLLGGDCADLLRRYITTDCSPAELADREGANPAKFYTRWYRCLERARDILRKNGVITD